MAGDNGIPLLPAYRRPPMTLPILLESKVSFAINCRYILSVRSSVDGLAAVLRLKPARAIEPPYGKGDQ